MLLSLALALLSLHMLAQTRITGVVSNASGEVLAGVNISVKGTTMSTITDEEGVFELHTELGANLLITLAGYQPARASAEQEMRIVLQTLETDSHRFSVWAAGAISSPLEAYSKSSKFWDYSYAGANIGLGYQLRHKAFLFLTGVELASINYKMDFEEYENIPLNYMVYTNRLQVPILAGMEQEYWYWLAGACIGMFDYSHLIAHNQQSSQKELQSFNQVLLTFAPSAEIGVNFNRPQQHASYKLALYTEVQINPGMYRDLHRWWLHTLLGIKFTVALSPRI